MKKSKNCLFIIRKEMFFHCRLEVLNLIQELEVPNQYGEGFINRYLMKPGQSSGGGESQRKILILQIFVYTFRNACNNF
jgi:hypothetical protein